VQLHEPPPAVLPDGHASHPQRDGRGREDDSHLTGEPACLARGPADRGAGLEGDPAPLAQAVVQPLPGVRVPREPLVRAIADDGGRLVIDEKARHGGGVTGLHAGQPRQRQLLDFGGPVHAFAVPYSLV
jgi:hypothetical protein